MLPTTECIMNINTKLELAAEAIESLVVAAVARGVAEATRDETNPALLHQEVAIARDAVKDALRDLVA